MLVKIKRTKGGVWSIRSLSREHYGNVVGTAKAVHLSNVRFGSTCITGRIVSTWGVKLVHGVHPRDVRTTLRDMPVFDFRAFRGDDKYFVPARNHRGHPQVQQCLQKFGSTTVISQAEEVLCFGNSIWFSPTGVDDA